MYKTLLTPLTQALHTNLTENTNVHLRSIIQLDSSIVSVVLIILASLQY